MTVGFPARNLWHSRLAGVLLISGCCCSGAKSPSFTPFSRYSPIRFVPFSPIALGRRPAYNRPTLDCFLPYQGRRKVAGLRLAGFTGRHLILRNHPQNDTASLVSHAVRSNVPVDNNLT